MLDILQSLCYDIDMNEIKLCKNGHERTPENLSTNRNCIICMKENGKRWYLNNIEKDKERKNKWRLNNTEKEKEMRDNCKKAYDKFKMQNYSEYIINNL